LDLSQFPSNSTKAVNVLNNNWRYSSINVLVWNALIAANIAIPITAYAEAFNHTPVYLGDYSWEWSYSVIVSEKTYDVSLVGKRIDNETFSMEITLSESGGFQDFKWFEGVIRYDLTEANWTISHSPVNPVEYLDIHFQKDFETEVASIRYTVTDPNNKIYNAYIEYGVDPVLDFDAYYTIFMTNSITNIEWDRITGAGRVMDFAHFQDQQWHCWDSLLEDVDCN
jgi:hypothetical protein